MRRWIAIGSLAVTSMLTVGCGAAPPARDASAPAESETERTFPAGMETPTRIETITIGGRTLGIYAAGIAMNPRRSRLRYILHYAGQQLTRDGVDIEGVPRDRFFELRDEATGKVLLPLDYHQIVALPGRGVLVLDAKDRLRFGSDGSGSEGKLHNDLKAHHDTPAAASDLPRWRRFDLARNQLVDTDIVMVERYTADRKDDAKLEAELRRPSWILVHRKPDESVAGKKVGRLDAEVVSPSGELLGSYAHFAPTAALTYTLDAGNAYRMIDTRGRFSVLGTWKDDGSRQDHLLGRFLELREIPAHRVLPVGAYLAKIAPGTSVRDDLWHLLQTNAVFSAPAGITGFRPVSVNWIPAFPESALRYGYGLRVDFWLVRYAFPGEPGHVPGTPAPAHRWGKASADFSQLTGPIWDSAEVVLPPTADLDKNHRTEFYDFPLLITGTGDLWTASALNTEIGAPRKEPREVTASSSEAVVQRMIDNCVQALKSDVAKKAAAEQRERERIAYERERAWSDAVRSRDADRMRFLVWEMGGDHWYTYAMAVREPSPEVLQEAAGHVKDAAKAKELRAKAEVRRKEIARLAEEAKRWEQQKLAAQEVATQAAATEYAGSWSLPSSSYTPPTLSAQQQRYAYETQLNRQIFGTPWDPYKSR